MSEQIIDNLVEKIFAELHSNATNILDNYQDDLIEITNDLENISRGFSPELISDDILEDQAEKIKDIITENLTKPEFPRAQTLFRSLSHLTDTLPNRIVYGAIKQEDELTGEGFYLVTENSIISLAHHERSLPFANPEMQFIVLNISCSVKEILKTFAEYSNL